MAKTDDAPTYSPLDRYIIDVTEHAMEVASRPEMKDPPNRNGDIFDRTAINTYVQGTAVDMSKAAKQIQEEEDEYFLAELVKWHDAQPWYRKLWWRIKRWLTRSSSANTR